MRRMHQGRGRRLRSHARTAAAAALAAAMAVSNTIPAHAETAAECNTNLTVAAGSSQTRQVTLTAGEQIAFSATAEAGAPVTVSLVGGTGSPRTVLAGVTPSSASFAATETGTYAFKLEAGEAPAVVGMHCLATTTEADLQRAFVTRRSERLMMGEPTRSRIGAKPLPTTASSPVPSSLDTDEEGRPRRMDFSMSLSEIAAVGNPDAKLAPPSPLDFWLEGRYEAYATALPDGSAGDGSLGIVYLGTKYMLSPDIMLGALAQFDKTGEEAPGEAPTFSASGWMAGPYVSARLGSGVMFDGRAAWGRADETLGSELHHSGERQLLQARLSGNRQIEGWTFAPSVALRYFEEATAAAATPSAPSADAVTTGRVDLLPEVSRRYQLNSDTFVQPRFAVGGFWAFDDLESVASAHSAADMRLKAEAGVALGIKDGASLSATGGVEEGDAAAANVWSGQLQLKVPLNE